MSIPLSEQTPAEQKPAEMQPEPAATSVPRLHFIDGLRGLAMLMVLFYHCWLYGGQWAVALPLGHHAVNIAPVLGYGHIGVNLFLVLSGFCLYWPFVKQGKRPEPTLWQFAKKRCRRILPPYYAVLVLFGGLALFHVLPGQEAVTSHYLWNWLWIHTLMAHNLRPGYIFTLDGALWSLALEFQLYILFPVLVEAYRRFNARGVLWTVLAFCTLYRFTLVHEHSVTEGVAGYVLASSVFGRAFEFALGMFTAMLVSRQHAAKKWLLVPADFVVLGVVLAVSVLQRHGGDFQPLDDAKWGLLFAALILGASRTNSVLHRVLSGPLIVRLGIFSYSVYLVHLPLIFALAALTQRRHFSNTADVLFYVLLVAPLMLGVGYVFHLLFEKPFMSAPARRA